MKMLEKQARKAGLKVSSHIRQLIRESKPWEQWSLIAGSNSPDRVRQSHYWDCLKGKNFPYNEGSSVTEGLEAKKEGDGERWKKKFLKFRISPGTFDAPKSRFIGTRRKGIFQGIDLEDSGDSTGMRLIAGWGRGSVKFFLAFKPDKIW